MWKNSEKVPNEYRHRMPRRSRNSILTSSSWSAGVSEETPKAPFIPITKSPASVMIFTLCLVIVTCLSHDADDLEVSMPDCKSDVKRTVKHSAGVIALAEAQTGKLSVRGSPRGPNCCTCRRDRREPPDPGNVGYARVIATAAPASSGRPRVILSLPQFLHRTWEICTTGTS